jgi:hypothetical protein
VILWCGLLIGALLLVFLLPALDTNDKRNQEEEEFGDHPEEDQGQAKKGKPSKLVAYLIPVLYIA